MCKIWIFGGTTEGRLLAEYCSREKIEAWVSVASEYGEELLQEELMESGNAGNPDLNHNTKESGQCADKEICFAKKSLKNVQASSVIKSYADGWIVTRWKNLSETRGFIL